MRTPVTLIALCLASMSAGCAGPPVPAPIEEETLCLDYQVSGKNEKMYGGVRVPVVVTILDGKKPIAKETLYGRREKDAPRPAPLIPDDNAEYTVEWAQCSNRRAERPLSAGHDSNYQCGEAKVYKTEKLVTKKGNEASRTLRFPFPPDATCWIGDVMPPPGSGKLLPTPPPLPEGPTPVPTGSAAPAQ